jgi:hypothetical protein
MWLVALVALTACRAASSAPTAVFQTAKGPVRVSLEIVADDASRARGLMYRNHLDDGHGMLFVFDDESDRSFWMKNTLIPLDIIFIGGRHDRRDEDQHDAPLLPPLGGETLQMGPRGGGGYTGRAGITTGDRIELPGTPEAGVAAVPHGRGG